MLRNSNVREPSTYVSEPPLEPVTGDIWISHDNTIKVWKYGYWQDVIADHTFPHGYIQVADARISADDIHKILSVADRLPEVVMFIDFLQEKNPDSEISKMFRLYQAQKIIERAK